MIKNLIIAVLLLGYTPFIFLATSVEDIEGSDRNYNCIVSEAVHVDQLVGLGSTYISTGMQFEKRIIIPYFNVSGNISEAQCGDKSFSLGNASQWLKAGDKISVSTKLNEVYLFGFLIVTEESPHMFGSGWNEDYPQGEYPVIRYEDEHGDN